MDIPKDDDGFTTSFALDDINGEEAKAFFDRFGFLVIKDVLSAEECNQSLDELWEELEEAKAFVRIDRRPEIESEEQDRLYQYLREKLDGKHEDDGLVYEVVGEGEGDRAVRFFLSRNIPVTWSTSVWPASPRGIVKHPFSSSPQFWSNRMNPRLHQAFATLYDDERLLVTFDRTGAMRPTMGKNGRTEWRTAAQWLHHDQNAWSKAWSLYGFKTIEGFVPAPQALRLQGSIALEESREQDGGFLCVPGAHKMWDSYRQAFKGSEHEARYAPASFVPIPEEALTLTGASRHESSGGDSGGDDDDNGAVDEKFRYPPAKAVPVRKGSLIMWDARVAHCNTPNFSERFRFVQYVTMVPAVTGGVKRTNDLPRDMLPDHLSDLGSKLIGLTPWEGAPAGGCTSEGASGDAADGLPWWRKLW